MATITLKTAQLEAGLDKINGAVIRSYPEAASQSFKKDDFVYLVAGKVTVCADDPSTILGMALQPATGVTDTPIAVAVFDENTRVIVNYYDGAAGKATAVITPQTFKALVQISDSKWVADFDTAAAFANDILIVEALYTGDALADVGGRLVCKIKPSAIQSPDSLANPVRYVAGRVAASAVNAGATLIPAVPGKKIRVLSARLQAVGGAITGSTTVDILGTQTTGKKLLASAIGGGWAEGATHDMAGGTTIAESFVANDVNTAVTIAVTGSAFATASHVGYVVEYALEG